MSARSLLAAFGLAAGFLVGTLAAPTDAQQTTSTWRAPRTPSGDPDLQGTWTNVTATPLERPRDLAGKPVLTEEERAERFRQFTLETTTDAVPRAGSAGSHNEYWRERGVLLQRTSLLVDPPDGRLPPLTPEAQQVRSRLAAARRTSPADGPESRDLFERCVTRGLPGTMMGNFYNHNYEILQTPDHVVIFAEMIHDVRIIPLDGRPHVDRRIGQWLGDSRGRWEGDTLVVETTNLRAVDQTTISRGLGVITLGTSAAARVIERFTRRGPEATAGLLPYTPWRVSCARCGVKVRAGAVADGSSVFTAATVRPGADSRAAPAGCGTSLREVRLEPETRNSRGRTARPPPAGSSAAVVEQLAGCGGRCVGRTGCGRRDWCGAGCRAPAAAS